MRAAICVGLLIVSAVSLLVNAAEPYEPTIDYQAEAKKAVRQEYLCRQGHAECEKPKSVIINTQASQAKTKNVRGANGQGTLTYGGTFLNKGSSSNNGHTKTYTRAEYTAAMDSARQRYREAKQNGEIPPAEPDTAGVEYKDDLNELLNNLKAKSSLKE